MPGRSITCTAYERWTTSLSSPWVFIQADVGPLRAPWSLAGAGQGLEWAYVIPHIADPNFARLE